MVSPFRCSAWPASGSPPRSSEHVRLVFPSSLASPDPVSSSASATFCRSIATGTSSSSASIPKDEARASRFKRCQLCRMGPWTRRQRLPCAYPDKVLKTVKAVCKYRYLYGNFFARDDLEKLARESSTFNSSPDRRRSHDTRPGAGVACVWGRALRPWRRVMTPWRRRH